MENFAGALPSLKTLGLTYSYSPSSSALCRSYLSKTKLRTLEKLTLDSTFLSAKYLVTTIGKLTSLEELHLVSVSTFMSTCSTKRRLQPFCSARFCHVLTACGIDQPHTW